MEPEKGDLRRASCEIRETGREGGVLETRQRVCPEGGSRSIVSNAVYRELRIDQRLAMLQMTLARAILVNHVSKGLIVVHLRENGKKATGVSKQRRKLFKNSFSVKENREIELWCIRGSGVKRHLKNSMHYIISCQFSFT